MDSQSHFVTVNDGVSVHALTAGSGPPVVLLAGGGFTNAIFHYQFNELAQHFHVIALSMCGHGKSDRVAFGMRPARLAQDLKMFLKAFQINKTNVLAYSLGCSVVYAFIDLFTTDALDNILVVDESAV